MQSRGEGEMRTKYSSAQNWRQFFILKIPNYFTYSKACYHKSLCGSITVLGFKAQNITYFLCCPWLWERSSVPTGCSSSLTRLFYAQNLGTPLFLFKLRQKRYIHTVTKVNFHPKNLEFSKSCHIVKIECNP